MHITSPQLGPCSLTELKTQLKSHVFYDKWARIILTLFFYASANYAASDFILLVASTQC